LWVLHAVFFRDDLSDVIVQCYFFSLLSGQTRSRTLNVKASRFPMSKATLFLCLIASWCFQCLASDPAPIPVPVGTEWYGYDGNWSPVNIRVGSPSQWLSVYPNTAGQEIWVIGPGGCDGTAICAEKRGGLFYRDQSSTWSTINTGYYQLNFDVNLGDTGYAFYGLENVSLSDQVSVPSQIVAIMNSTEFWLGSLGLGIQESRFEGTMNHITFLSTLVETAGLIPSHSYGYTAGAYYSKSKCGPERMQLLNPDRVEERPILADTWWR
jgi:hypothetical protein